jgi:hypothetical protein
MKAIDYTSPTHPENLLTIRKSDGYSATTTMVLVFNNFFVLERFAGRERKVKSIA